MEHTKLNGVVRITGASVCGGLLIRAEWAGHLDALRSNSGSSDSNKRDTLLCPSCSDFVTKRVFVFTASSTVDRNLGWRPSSAVGASLKATRVVMCRSVYRPKTVRGNTKG